MTFCRMRLGWTAAALALALASSAAQTNPKFWSFKRPIEAQPVITPDPQATFDCPLAGKTLHWEATHAFNPAAVVKDGKIWVIYRAEDETGTGIGGYTSRLGIASSTDGIHFKRFPKPVLYPDRDSQQSVEWPGGCEDPRCLELENGTYAVFYTQYSRAADGSAHTQLGLATSKDLFHWDKKGPVKGTGSNGESVVPLKSASLITEVRHGRVIAKRIDGKYWLFYGVGTIRLLTSTDLKTWQIVPNFELKPRPGKFDSALVECGPPAILTGSGITLFYNGMNSEGSDRDPKLGPLAYSGGQAVFDPKDPTHLIARTETPFISPVLPWESIGQYARGTTFLEGLVLFKKHWFLYYGCADTYVGVAIRN
jgi:predicted GH43/DUF377 family glycosyl hydrolase